MTNLSSEIAAYCWPQSAKPGDAVSFYCHTTASAYAMRCIRQGAEDEVVFERRDQKGMHQEMPGDLSVNGCGWTKSLDIEIDASWRSGFYLIELVTDDGATAEAFFVVRPTRKRKALLVLATTTYAAYNEWGGPSFYTGGSLSSMQRPLPKGFLKKPDPARFRAACARELPSEQIRKFLSSGNSYWCMSSGWCNWEILFVRWAEQYGIAFDYATGQDLDAEPDLLDGYECYISIGHDEYWSKNMRDRVESWVDAGGKAAFFSGNTSFWQIRFEADHSRVVGYKLDLKGDPVFGTDQEQTLSTMWSDPLVGRPENHLTGVSFTRGGYARLRNAPRGSGGYTIWRPSHWAFEGLGLIAGDIVGANPPTVGYECDGCELTLENGLPVATGADGTPENFEVLGTAPAHLWETSEGDSGMPSTYVGELNWVAERLGGADTQEIRERFANGRAVMGSFTKGRGEVFTTGCTDWAYGLSDSGVAQITMNVLGRFGAI